MTRSSTSLHDTKRQIPLLRVNALNHGTGPDDPSLPNRGRPAGKLSRGRAIGLRQWVR